jgi:hypothetical protein
MIREQVTCKGCGVVFESHHRGRDYCTTICRVIRSAAGGAWGTCIVCNTAYRPGPYEAGKSRTDFVKEHEVCRRTLLDEGARPDDCRCVECKRRKGITTTLTVPPSVRKRRAASHHSKHRKFILERDNYICQVCGLPTDPEARPTDDRYPTLDHISSFAGYGGGDEPENLRTAHRWCNLMLGDNGFVVEESVRASARERFASAVDR